MMRHFGLAAVLALSLLSAACGPTIRLPISLPGASEDPLLTDVSEPGATASIGLNTSEDGQATTNGTGPRVAGRQTVQVQRATLPELLSLTGRVAAPQEESVTSLAAGKVETVPVRVGQQVEQGQVLVQLESNEAGREIAAARARLEVAILRLQQLDAQGAAAQVDAARQAENARARYQAALSEAEATLRRAQENRERVEAGPSASERRAAEDAVSSARLLLQRAENELARIERGPDVSAIGTAEREVSAARAALARAQNELDRLQRGADPLEVRAAEREVERAQNAL
jgi:multidrug efflux pump subunit AcrA (membrane-fusion protein)